MATLVISSGDSTEILEAVDGSLDHIAPSVSERVKGGRTAAPGTAREALTLGIFAFGTDAAHSPGWYRPTLLAGTIGAIYPNPRHPFSRTPTTHARDGNGVQYRLELGHVGALSCGYDQRQWLSLPVHTKMNLGRCAATGTPQPVVAQGPLFSALAGLWRAPVALRWALMWVTSSAAPSQSIFPAASATP